MKPLPKHNFHQAPQWDNEAFIKAHLTTPFSSIRINPFKKKSELFDIENKVNWCENACYLTERPIFTLDPLFHSGAYYVQEASSMFIGYVFEYLLGQRNTPIKVLDLCAAPGGKSTHIASLLNKEDLLISNEVIQSRASILSENMARWGYMNTWVSQNDPKDFSTINNYFDVIIIDAPCTGSGLWRKDEKAQDQWSLDAVKLCSERQKRIITDALPSLKDNGILLYSTCSYSTEENEEVLDWICEHFNGESLSIPIKEEWGIVSTQAPISKANGYRFYPWEIKGEGFFLAAFRMKNNTKSKSLKPTKNKSNHKPIWEQWLACDFDIITKNEFDISIHPTHVDDYFYLQNQLRLKKTGTLLGKVLPKEAIPEHELALSIYLSPSVPQIQVTKEEALLYLKKEPIQNDVSIKGWHAVTYQGQCIGWGKWLGNRMNNYLPNNWRIRMEINK